MLAAVMLTTCFIMLVSVKYMQFEKTYQLFLEDSKKKPNIWNAKNREHSRFTSFILRSFYHHALSKGRKVLHGAGGSMYLIFGLIEAGWFFVTRGNRAPDTIRTMTLLSGTTMALGCLTPYMIRKQSKLGFKKFTFLRYLGLGLGCMFSANSIYAHPSSVYDDSNQSSSIDSISMRVKLEDICTIISLILPVLSILCVVYELRKRYIWTTKSTALPVLTPLATIHGPIIYHLLFGPEALEQFYQESNTGQAIYVLNLLGGVFTAFDILLLTMALRKVLYFNQRLRMVSMLWACYGILCTLMISFCCTIQIAFVYILYCGLTLAIQKCIPKWCFDNWLENRKDLMNVDDGHQKGVSYY